MEICSSCPSSSSPLSLHRTINNHHHPPNYSYSPGIVRKSPSTSFLCNPFRVDRRVPNFNLHSNRNNNNNNSNGVKILPRAAIQTHRSWLEAAQKGLTALALTAAIHLSPVLAHNLANANEFDVLNGNPPTETYIIDDAGVLNRVTKTDVKKLLSDLEARRGYHIDCVTLRKLTSKADAFEFADLVLERWYPTVEEGNNKGLVLLVTTQKEGAVTGGPAFIRAVGDKVLEGVVSENLPDYYSRVNFRNSSVRTHLGNSLGSPEIVVITCMKDVVTFSASQRSTMKGYVGRFNFFHACIYSKSQNSLKATTM